MTNGYASNSPVILGLGVLLWLYITVLAMFILISLCCCLKRSKTAPVVQPRAASELSPADNNVCPHLHFADTNADHIWQSVGHHRATRPTLCAKWADEWRPNRPSHPMAGRRTQLCERTHYHRIYTVVNCFVIFVERIPNVFNFYEVFDVFLNCYQTI